MGDALAGTPFVPFALNTRARFGTQGRQIGQRQHGERGMAMPAMPTACFAMVEPDLAFSGLETLFDGPAPAGDPSNISQACVAWREDDVVGAISLILSAAPDQQPILSRWMLQAQKTNARPVVDALSLRSLSGRVTFPGTSGQRLAQLSCRAARMTQKSIIGYQPLIAADR